MLEARVQSELTWCCFSLETTSEARITAKPQLRALTFHQNTARQLEWRWWNQNTSRIPDCKYSYSNPKPCLSFCWLSDLRNEQRRKRYMLKTWNRSHILFENRMCVNSVRATCICNVFICSIFYKTQNLYFLRRTAIQMLQNTQVSE